MEFPRTHDIIHRLGEFDIYVSGRPVTARMELQVAATHTTLRVKWTNTGTLKLKPVTVRLHRVVVQNFFFAIARSARDVGISLARAIPFLREEDS